MSSVLLVFAKVPRPGDVKTRLTPALSASEAAQLYDAFLRDALSLYADLSADVHLYLAPPLPDDGFDKGPDDVSVHRQTGDGLGERMREGFREAFEQDYDRACIVGTDHPTLPLAFLQQSFSALEKAESICIGPSDDGGFYLLGMSAFYPQLFERMSYSHDRVFADTLARVDETDARLTVLPQWYDIDTPENLRRLLSDLENDVVEAPNTRRTVEEMDLENRDLRRRAS